MVLVETAFGGRRVMDLLAGDPAAEDLLSMSSTSQRWTNRGEWRWPLSTEFVPDQAKTEAVRRT